MGILATDIVLISRVCPTGNTLIQRGDSLVVLSGCCQETYSISALESGGFSYTCGMCEVVVTAPHMAWNPVIEDLTNSVEDANKESWKGWINFWFGIDNAEVEIS